MANLAGGIPLCCPVSAHPPGHLRPPGLSSLHQVPAGQPGAAGGELRDCIRTLQPVTFLYSLLFRSRHTTAW